MSLKKQQFNFTTQILAVSLLLLLTFGWYNFNPNSINQTKIPLIGDAGDTVDSNEGHFSIDNWDDAYVTQNEVEDFAQVLEDAYDILIGDWNMPDPMDGSREPPIEVTIEQILGDYNGWACCPDREKNFKLGFYPDYINQGFAADHEPLKVAGHELLHNTQYAHPGDPPSKWVREGHARLSQDKVSNWLDHADGTEAGSSFVRQTQGYLAGSHTSDLTSLTYAACLFWQYFCEQFGSDHTDPDYGWDALTTFWDTTVNPTGEHGIEMTNNALDSLDPGKTFEDVFQDFSIALYTKDLDDSSVPPEWTFVDDNEADGSSNYGSVSLELDPVPTLSSFSGPIEDNGETIDSWSNKYYEIDIDPSVDVITLQFNQSTQNDLFYGLIATRGDDLEYSYTIESQNFRRAIVNENYDKIAIIVAGLENDIITPSIYNYRIEAGSPFIDIEYPKSNPVTYRARAGPHNATEKFISIVDAFYRKSTPVHGFFTENFQARVGGKNATILNAVDVYGKYFLEILAPEQDSDGLYNLEVDLIDTDGNILDTDTQELCVEYGDTYFDTMLSIDKSGSMATHDKILAAQSAAKLFTNSFLSEDQLGVVQFEGFATVIHDLMKLTPSNRSTAITKIDSIVTGAVTSIGDGLLKSQEQLYTRGDSEYPDHIIVLSDGQENTAPWISDALPYILGNGTSVHVITIGADADTELMQELAADTGGMYFYCFDPSSGDIPNDLAELYRAISENIKKLERFYHQRGQITSGTTKDFKLKVTNDMDIIEFIVHYNASIAPTSIELYNPKSQSTSFDYTNDKSGMGHAVARLKEPMDGEWTIRIEVDGSSSDLKYFVEGAAHSTGTITLMTPPNGYISTEWGNTEPRGSRIPILVSLSDKKPIINANIKMSVIPPGYKQNHTIFEIPLYDDGNHGDSLANDGIYGNIYTPTSELGSYQYTIIADGKNNEGNDFQRIKTGAFYLHDTQEKPGDRDYDGLPDNWELFYGLKDDVAIGEHGPNGDPDQDFLKNIHELFYGTNPLDSDTDNGGQGDFSEVNFNLNPLNPEDDTTGYFPNVRIYPGNNSIHMIMPNSTYNSFLNLYIYRSTHPSFGYSQIYGGTYVNKYNDTSVTNYNTYYYRFLASYATYNETGFTKPYMAIPKENVIPSEASIILNYGNKTTRSNLVNVKVKISKNDDTGNIARTPSYIRYSEDPAKLKDQAWLPFVSTFPYSFSNNSGLKFLFIQLKDNQSIPEISPIFSAGIYYTGEIVESIGLPNVGVVLIIGINIIIFNVIFIYKKRNKLKSKN